MSVLFCPPCSTPAPPIPQRMAPTPAVVVATPPADQTWFPPIVARNLDNALQDATNKNNVFNNDACKFAFHVKKNGTTPRSKGEQTGAQLRTQPTRQRIELLQK